MSIYSNIFVLNLIEKHRLNATPIKRYIESLKGLPRLNFGYSYVENGQSVQSIIFRHAPVSLTIGLFAVILSVVMSLTLSTFLSFNRRANNIFNFTGVTIISVPVFVIAILMQFVITVKGGLLPVYGIDDAAGYILPVVILSIVPTIVLTQLLTHDMRMIRQSLYVLAARARGLPSDSIMINYILKNSLTTSITYAAPIAANILAGSFVVESIFNIPGLGRYFVNSITNRDYPVIAGLTIFYSIILITLNTMANIAVKANDRRSRLGDGGGEK